MQLRRGRFVDLVERQLELFEREQAGLIRDTDAALRAYNAAGAEEAEERYGDFLDLVETARDELVSFRETYARTLEPEARAEYEDVFARVVRKRLPRFGLELEG
jgi:hypothetical protein